VAHPGAERPPRLSFMLFDLRGRGRRRTVQVIYLSLAILMGGGLVLFGVGGSVDGGLLNAFSGGGSTNSNDITAKRLAKAEKAVQLHPRDANALKELVRAHYASATLDANTNAFTTDGLKELRGASNAWKRYVAVAGDKVDPTVASLMAQAYSPAALNQPQLAFEAMQTVVDARPPTAGLYVQYAAFAYAAKQGRQAELASKKALSLASPDDREQIKGQLDELAAAATAESSATVTTTPDASTTTAPAGTATATTTTP
jgi:hypothetical protein